MLMRCRRLLRMSMSSAGIVGLAAALLWVANTGATESPYIDLRRIQPIHGDVAAGARKAAVCHACHGVGTSAAPTFPRLAGQRPDYLYHRLLSFKRADSKDPYYARSPMSSQAANLSDADMRDLAAYFAAQTPTAAAMAAVPTAIAGKGKELFLAGDSAHGIPPCQGCHGADATGTSNATGQYAAYPSLRGQYSMYLVARLTSFHNNLPHHTTNDFIMSDVARTLDDDSIQAIAAWLSSLTPFRGL
jgi:cytochrome c553